MILKRWQAPNLPSPEQMKMLLFAEGLKFEEEVYPAQAHMGPHKHPFDEVRMVISGSMIFNLSGNKVLLRAGDRIEIPSNTLHEMTVHSDEECRSIVAFKVF
tara:strand:+ start:1826 stop:2131 length:306 start_codon:yes stop_codon:yes gene_type:complete